MVWKGLTYGLVVGLAVLVGAVLVGQFFGVPVAVSYVETDSMEPTISAGDGYIAVPAEVAGPIEEGDVITFEAEELHGGSLTTHRVVEITEQGYVTQGDANPFTDQDSDEPYVTEGQVVAKALTLDGKVVTVPHLGTVITGIGTTLERGQQQLAILFGSRALLGTQGVSYILFGFGVVILLIGGINDRKREEFRTQRSRDRTQSRTGFDERQRLLLFLVVFLVAITVGTMLASSGSDAFGIVSSEQASERADVVPTGETETQTRTVHNGGVLPEVVVLEPASDGVAIDETTHRLGRNSKSEVSISYTAPPETGYYLRGVSERRYFAVLPTSVILSLHTVHPWLATAVVAIVIVLPVTITISLLFGTERIRTRIRRQNEGS